ncbi:unnamed protein product [Closterium sp. NIES-54]
MLALCREQRLEHRTKHIALRYFLARELQQRGQLRLAYVASEANTADVFTKALAPCDHQRCCTQLGGFQESDSGEVRFPEISTPILEKLCQYFYYKLRYSNPANQKNIPEFKIEPEIALELLMAANYLDT